MMSSGTDSGESSKITRLIGIDRLGSTSKTIANY